MPCHSSSSSARLANTRLTSANCANNRASFLPGIGFLRGSQVLRLIPISKSKLWRHAHARTFPQPVKLSQRVTAWRAEDVRRWIEQQAAAWKLSSTAPCSRHCAIDHLGLGASSR